MANGNLKTIQIGDTANLKVHGRTTGGRNPLVLFWTGSGIEVNANGTELWIEVEADYGACEPWISILVNGAPVGRQMVTKGRHWICLFRGMSPGETKNVRVVKDTQAMSGDPDCYLAIHAARFDGELLPVAERPYKIEFVGDSITSGEGAIGAKAEQVWVPMWFSAVRNYASLTAEALEADARILSQSGWGVLTSWDNDPRCSLPAYYEKVCGLLTGERNEALGARDDHDFAAWQPDVVVVNLGTNDGSAFQTPAWMDEEGRAHKQRLNEDGTYNEDDLNAFEAAVRGFLATLRRCNPRARLVWAYGMLGVPMLPAIRRAVDTYANETGDRRVSVFRLPEMTEESVGARAHPGALAHERAAAQLSAYLKGLLASGE